MSTLNAPIGSEQTADSLYFNSSLQHLAQEVQETVDLHWHPRRLMGHRDDFHWRGEGLCRFGHLPHLPWYRRGWILPWGTHMRIENLSGGSC